MAWACAGHAQTTAPNPAAFDHMLQQLNDGALAPDSAAAMQQALSRLHALLPPSDAARQRRYDYIYCFYQFIDTPTAGMAYARQGIAQSRQANDLETLANFEMCQGYYLSQADSERAALPSFDAAVQAAQKLGNPHLIADALTWRGNTHSLLGDQALAMVDLLAAQREYESTHGTQAAARGNLSNIASLYRRMGEYDAARDYLQQAMVAAQDAGDLPLLRIVRVQQGFLATESGHPEDGIAPLSQALTLARASGQPDEIGAVLLAQAENSNARGRYADALQQVADAGKAFAAAKDNSNAGMLALQAAEAHAGLGQHNQAASEFALAQSHLANSGNLRYLAELYTSRAANEEAMGHTQAALDDLKRKIATEAELARKTHAQVTTLMRYRFDTARHELETRKLLADRKLQAQQVAALKRVRGWQWLAIVLGGLLTALISALGYRQWRRGRRLNRLSLTDPLTGVSNRRHMEYLLGRAIERARTAQQDLAVIMLDIDHFKQVNDNHGHAAGDQVLRDMASLCQTALRQFDRFGRIGGEEFLLVLPATGLDGGLLVAERLRAQVAAAEMAAGDTTLHITISLGVTTLHAADDNCDTLLQRADAMLYRAKDAGRNRVEATA